MCSKMAFSGCLITQRWCCDVPVSCTRLSALHCYHVQALSSIFGQCKCCTSHRNLALPPQQLQPAHPLLLVEPHTLLLCLAQPWNGFPTLYNRNSHSGHQLARPELLLFRRCWYFIHRSSGQPAGTTLSDLPATGPSMFQASYKATARALTASCGLPQREQALSLKFCLQRLPANIIATLY